MTELTILRVLGGSRAYGIDTPESDEDIIEVYVEDWQDVLGPHEGRVRPTHTSLETGDRARYPLRRFVHLALQGNPTVIESFWAPRLAPTVRRTTEDLTLRTDWNLGTELLNLRKLLVGTHVRPRYLGYMHEQTKRLLGLRGGHSAGRRPSDERVGYDTKFAAHVLRLGYQCLELLTTGELDMPMEELDERRQYIMAVRRGDVGFDEWFNRALNIDAIVKAVDGSVPNEPDRHTVELWCAQAHFRAWGYARG